MKRIIFTYIFLILIVSEVSAYSDISNDFWAYSAINNLTEDGILTGYPDGTFKPGKNVTAAEFITVLTKIIQLDADKSGNLCHWADKNIEAARKNSILNIEEYEDFNPDEYITRLEICKMIVRSFDATKNTKYTDKVYFFQDISPENDEEQRITRILKEIGILNGYPDGTVKLNNNATRAEISCFMYLLKNKLNEIREFTANSFRQYEENIAVENIGTKNIKLRKYEFAKEDFEYCTTTINKIEFFEFNNALNTKYKDVFKEIYNSKEPYFIYRNNLGKNKTVMAIEFSTKNNTDKYDIFTGYEFLHVRFPEEEINILDSFDTDEFIRQKNKNGSVGEMVKPGEMWHTLAFYVLDKLPGNKLEINRSITTLRECYTEKIVNADLFHSAIICLEE